MMGKLPPAPFTDPAPLLRLIVATVAAGASTMPGSSAGASAAIPAASGGGGGGGSRDSLLAEVLGTTKLPAAKGKDGHERVVPLPAGYLSLVQADALVPKRPLLEAALALGQTEADADACANLGVVQDVVDGVTGQVTKVRQSDEATKLSAGR